MNLSSGWNLGNTLDAFTSQNNQPPMTQEMSWGNPKTTNEMIKLVSESGFDVLRVPVTWGKQLSPKPDYKINKLWLDRVQEVVDYGINNNMTVILNMHHEEWLFPSEENYAEASEKLKAIWIQIAERFAEYDDHLIFEGLNEPRKIGTNVEWTGGDPEGREIVMRLNSDFVKTIRNTGGNNKTRKLMVPAYAASSDEKALKDFVIPDDRNIIVSIHAYTPYRFALSEEDVSEWSADNKNDTRDIDELFKRIDKYFLSRGIPVILGECGARNKDNTEARVEWAKYYAGRGREYGVPCIWWDNGVWQGTGELFGLMDRRNVKWEFPDIVSAFTLSE